jgi:predicted nuclease of predicted toxin-antitoxin system
MILLDQGLPRTTVLRLRELGLHAEHVGDCGFATADDRTILDEARRRGQILVTLDADFHAQLALSGAAAPSVIRIRIEGLKAERLAALLRGVLEQCSVDLKSGGMITITESGTRVRRLPLRRF